MNDGPGDNTALVISHLSLRKAIGILATSFPFVLFLGAAVIFDTGIPHSISSYYHTGMRDVFVGILFAVGFLLLSYRGYDHADDIAGDLGCLFAVCVAIFPTMAAGAATAHARIVGYIHLAFAALFFLTLIYFSLFLFTKTNPNRPPSKRKVQRNMIYRLCGYAMSICIVCVAVYELLPQAITSSVRSYKPVFWLEAIAVVAFGVSWLTKGEAILKNEDENL